jgi:predicted RNA-binding Zn-ribbon protein involved in translation (DUF1610 family)
LVNLSRIQKIGVRNWLTEQKSRWSCPECGTRFTWYDETCDLCRNKLYNCQSEDKKLPREDGQA